jgi:hypothetical protein
LPSESSFRHFRSTRPLKRDERRLVRMECGTVASESLRKHLHHMPRIVFVLKLPAFEEETLLPREVDEQP